MYASKKAAGRKTGSICTVFLSLFVLAMVFLGALAVDIYRYVCVKHELQNATDAGALAGAQELWTDLQKANDDAYTVTGFNQADGRLVSNSTTGVAVSVTVVPPGTNLSGTVEVDASMPVRHLIAPIFGRQTDVVHCVSVAGTTGNLKTVYADQVFPLAVSANASPTGSNGATLVTAKIGDTFNLNINSQKYKNAAWTSLTADPANAHWIDTAIDGLLGTSPFPSGFFIPPVSVGDMINVNNGVDGQKSLGSGDERTALLNGPTLILPVIEGDPSFTKQYQVIGFIGFKVTAIKTNNQGNNRDNGNGNVETLIGTLQRVQVDGQSGVISTQGPDQTIIDTILSPGPIKLIR